MQELDQKFTFAKRLCQLAGSKIMGLRLQNWDVRHKGTQVKIDADIIIEKFLIDEIRKSFPEDEIISEEEFETTPQKKQHKNYWLLDPIDGTSSFVKGYDGFCSQMAYIEDGQVIFGVVSVPAYNKIYYAKLNEGSFVEENGLIKKLGFGKLKEKFTYIDSSQANEETLKKLNKIGVENYLECGSFGVKLCFIAEGKADLLFKPVEFKTWDIAPGGLILREAGGEYLSINGEEIEYDLKKIHYHGLFAASSNELLNKLIDLKF